MSVAVQAKLLCTHSYLVYEQAPAKAKPKPFFGNYWHLGSSLDAETRKVMIYARAD